MKQPAIIKRSHVSELIANNLMGHKPTKEYAGKEAHHWQEQLSCDEIKQIEERHAKQTEPTQRA